MFLLENDRFYIVCKIKSSFFFKYHPPPQKKSSNEYHTFGIKPPKILQNGEIFENK